MERCLHFRRGRGTRPSCASARCGWCSSTSTYPSQSKAIESIAQKVDLHRETLRLRIRRVEVDDGRRPGVMTDETRPDEGA
jgi:hypothetical protein